MRELFNKRALFAVAGALVLVVAGELVLAWQYRRLEAERLPAIEEKLQRSEAANVVEKFLAARVEGDRAAALLLMTEVAVEQDRRGSFELTDSYASWKVLAEQDLEEGKFLFEVELLDEDGFLAVPERVEAAPVNGRYYVDSVLVAG